MDNREIAAQFLLLARLMELHGENAFKIRSYQNAYQGLRNYSEPLSEMGLPELQELPGVGKAVADKIQLLCAGKKIPALERLIEKTPPGIIDLLQLKGLGPKRLKTLWEKLEIESASELLQACEENRLQGLKGFGVKSQASIQEKVKYHIASSGKMLYADADVLARQIEQEYPLQRAGALRRCELIIEELEFMGVSPQEISERWELLERTDEGHRYRYDESYSIFIYELREDRDVIDCSLPEGLSRERFNALKLDRLPPECWAYPEQAAQINREDLIQLEDLKGLVHCHTTDSDGAYSIEEMALQAQTLGYEYIVITDHSRSAFYAQGLSPDRLYQQIERIRVLNKEIDGIEILAGNEVDILPSGGLDYDDDLLAELDVVIGSIHSQLDMPIDKAMYRLRSAIEHPRLDILGHMTGRLLLARRAYPVDHKEIIDACAEAGVAIELNANPRRLDMDPSWIPYAMERGVMISINPDAHSTLGMEHNYYGTIAARRGLLTRAACLNALDLAAFRQRLRSHS